MSGGHHDFYIKTARWTPEHLYAVTPAIREQDIYVSDESLILVMQDPPVALSIYIEMRVINNNICL